MTGGGRNGGLEEKRRKAKMQSVQEREARDGKREEIKKKKQQQVEERRKARGQRVSLQGSLTRDPPPSPLPLHRAAHEVTSDAAGNRWRWRDENNERERGTERQDWRVT